MPRGRMTLHHHHPEQDLITKIDSEEKGSWEDCIKLLSQCLNQSDLRIKLHNKDHQQIKHRLDHLAHSLIVGASAAVIASCIDLVNYQLLHRHQLHIKIPRRLLLHIGKIATYQLHRPEIELTAIRQNKGIR